MTKTNNFSKEVDIFKFEDPLSYLKEFVSYFTDRGNSMRELSRKCGLASPNYFQKVLIENRSITLESSKKIAQFMGIKGHALDYWLALVKISLPNYKDKDRLKALAKAIQERAKNRMTLDTRIHENWLHAAVFEMARMDNFLMTTEGIHSRLKRHATLKDIASSLEFLLKHKFLIETKIPHRYIQASIEFDPYYDRRSNDMIEVHRQHLEIAKHRLNDDVRETEFLGLTTAIPFSRMKDIQRILRSALDEIEFEISKSAPCDEVIVLQVSTFKVT